MSQSCKAMTEALRLASYVSVGHPALAALAIGADLQAIFFQRAIKRAACAARRARALDFAGKNADAALNVLELLLPWPARE